jgi:hypothetical protein
MKLLLCMAIPLGNPCNRCVHYLPGKIPACKKIGTVDLVTGDMEYSSAQSVREYACGGHLYEHSNRNVYTHLAFVVVYVSTLIFLGRK